DEHYDPNFLRGKRREEAKVLHFPPDNTKDYNLLFTLPELDYALEKAMDTAPGPDGIHYQIIKHLSPDAKEYLLSLYNRIWMEGVIPRDWKEATVLPILKPGKDPTDSSSYRPIALTSCICKVLEPMINTPLVWQ